MSRKYAKPAFKFPASDVWAAAAAAQRINGSYVKHINIDDSTTQDNAQTNRQLVDKALVDNSLITDADRKLGETIRLYFKGLTFKILQGSPLSDFYTNAATISSRDVIESNYEIALITCLPQSYEREVKRAEEDARLNYASGGYLGRLDEKVRVSVEVIRCVYSVKWGIFFVSGLTSNDQAVFFSYKKPIESGTTVAILGTVKDQRDNTTRLSRVKIL